MNRNKINIHFDFMYVINNTLLKTKQNSEIYQVSLASISSIVCTPLRPQREEGELKKQNWDRRLLWMVPNQKNFHHYVEKPGEKLRKCFFADMPTCNNYRSANLVNIYYLATPFTLMSREMTPFFFVDLIFSLHQNVREHSQITLKRFCPLLTT